MISPMTLSIRDLAKTYPDGTHALRGVSLDAGPGIFGLLGPNGAGKSTLLRTIATLQRPDGGSIRFGDVDVLADPAALRRQLGYLPQDFGLYPHLSAEHTLAHFVALEGVHDRAERRAVVRELLARVNLERDRRRRVGTFSGGMRQRLGLAIALAGAPRLLVLDEPTAGLDPAERRRLYDLLAVLAGEREGAGIVVLLSTHVVEDVRELCDAFAIVDQGRVVHAGDPRAAVAALRGRLWQRAAAADELAPLAAAHRVVGVRRVARQPVLRLLTAAGGAAPDARCEPAEPMLEDVYFQHVGLEAERR